MGICSIELFCTIAATCNRTKFPYLSLIHIRRFTENAERHRFQIHTFHAILRAISRGRVIFQLQRNVRVGWGGEREEERIKSEFSKFPMFMDRDVADDGYVYARVYVYRRLYTERELNYKETWNKTLARNKPAVHFFEELASSFRFLPLVHVFPEQPVLPCTPPMYNNKRNKELQCRR